MLNVKAVATGFDLGNLEKEIKQDIDKIHNKLLALGEQTKLIMQSNIKAKRAGATGELSSAITVESRRNFDGLSIGVGNKDFIYKKAPYWYAVNYGKRYLSEVPFTPPANRGYFEGSPRGPQQGTAQNQKWTHRSNGKYTIFPKKIRPMNYIEKTIGWLATIWNTV
jgi:hypothetical protein